jgi:hypothetical protein
MLVVSPSPRELYDQLADEERVAVDLILATSLATSPEDLATRPEDRQLSQLVSDPRRLAFLRGLVPQLLAFGFTVGESEGLDHARAGWLAGLEEARRRSDEIAQVEVRDRDRDRAWRASLPPEVRRSVERRRRRRRRRNGGR